jgi:hypothetical protein
MYAGKYSMVSPFVDCQAFAFVVQLNLSGFRFRLTIVL